MSRYHNLTVKFEIENRWDKVLANRALNEHTEVREYRPLRASNYLQREVATPDDVLEYVIRTAAALEEVYQLFLKYARTNKVRVEVISESHTYGEPGSLVQDEIIHRFWAVKSYAFDKGVVLRRKWNSDRTAKNFQGGDNTLEDVPIRQLKKQWQEVAETFLTLVKDQAVWALDASIDEKVV